MTMQSDYCMTLYLSVMEAMTFDLPVWFTALQNNGDVQWHAAVKICQGTLDTPAAAVWTA